MRLTYRRYYATYPLALAIAGVFGVLVAANGPADDTAVLQARLDTGQTVTLPPGRFVVSATLRLTAPNQRLIGAGAGQTTIVAGGDFESVVRADNLRNVEVSSLTVDAGGDARKAATRTVGVWLANCRGAVVERVNVTGVRAGAGGNGVGVVVAGGERCLVRGCEFRGCGAPGSPADGVYASGSYHVVDSCRASGVTDTAFVLESCNYSGIVGCSAAGCSAGLAITALGSDRRGNYADSVSVSGWNAPVTGGVQVGALGAGNLLDTSLVNLSVTAPAGQGPAVNVRRTGPGKVAGLAVRGCTVDGAAPNFQGVLVDAADVVISGCAVRNTGLAGVQLMPRCLGVTVRGCTVSDPGRFGISVLCPAGELLQSGNAISGKALESPVKVFTGGAGS